MTRDILGVVTFSPSSRSAQKIQVGYQTVSMKSEQCWHIRKPCSKISQTGNVIICHMIGEGW